MLYAEQKSRQMASKMAFISAVGTILPTLYEYKDVEEAYNKAFGRKPILPEPEFSLEELDAAQKIIDDLA